MFHKIFMVSGVKIIYIFYNGWKSKEGEDAENSAGNKSTRSNFLPENIKGCLDRN